MRKAIVLVGVFLSFAFVSEAGDQVPVIYVPGINNTVATATSATSTLQEALGDEYRVIGFPHDAVQEDEKDFLADNSDLTLLKNCELEVAPKLSRLRILYNQDAPTMDGDLKEVARDILRVCFHGKYRYKTDIFWGVKWVAEQVSNEGGAILVAHSRGNLVAHLAVAELVRIHGAKAFGMVRIVNVGNTARFSMNGLDLTDKNDVALLVFGEKIGENKLADPTVASADEEMRTCAKKLLIGNAVAGCFKLVSLRHNFENIYLSERKAKGIQGVPAENGGATFREHLVALVETATSSLETEAKKVVVERKETFSPPPPPPPKIEGEIKTPPLKPTPPPYSNGERVRETWCWIAKAYEERGLATIISRREGHALSGGYCTYIMLNR